MSARNFMASVRLSATAQAVFDKAAERSAAKLATACGISESAVDRLRYGGAAATDTVARVERAMAEGKLS